MSTMSFQRKAVTVAVAGALSAGVAGNAYALNISGSDAAFPTLEGEFFLGAALTKVALTATGTAEALITAKIHYFDAADVSLGTSVTETDSDAGTGVAISLTVGAPAGVDYSVVTVDLSASSDTVGTSQYAYVNSDGVMVGQNDAAPPVDFASEAEAVAGAQAAANGKLDPPDAGYTGINITAAQVDESGVNNKVVYVTFNADPVGVDGAAVGAANFVEIKDSSVPAVALDKTVSDGTPGTPGEFLDANQRAFIEHNQAVGAVPPLTAFAGAISSVSTGGSLDDGAANGPSLVTTISPLTALAAPAYAGSGEVVIADGTAALLYDSGAAAITVSIRMDAEVADSTWEADDDVDVATATGSLPDANVGSYAVSADADGNDTILELTADAVAPNKFFIDPATGEVTYGLNRAAAEAVSVTVKKGASPVGLKINPDVGIAADLGVKGAVAGVAEAPELATLDSDKDGWIDAGTLDFKQDLSGLPSDANLGLVGYATTVANPAGVVLDTDPAAFMSGSASAVQLILTNPDMPKADGTAPDGDANNDYNADGIADTADAALVVKDNFNTGIALTYVPPVAGVPFAAAIGTDDLANPTTALTYARVYDAQTGVEKAVSTDTSIDFTEDGARPVVTSVTYFETYGLDEQEEDQEAGKVVRDLSGTVTIKTSEEIQPIGSIADAENDSINEFQFDGAGTDLLNLVDANIEKKVAIDIGAGDDSDEITLTNVPRTVLDNTLSLGVTGGAEDLNKNALFVADGNPDASTVVEASPDGPAIKAVEFKHFTDVDEWHIGVEYDQPIAAPEDQKADDKDAMFTVRALIGWDHTGQSSSDGGTPIGDPLDDPDNVSGATSLFQWVIPGANVILEGGAMLTLKIPGGGLPGDTTQVWVDYQGANADELANGSLKYLENTEEEPVKAKTDGDTQFDDEVPVGNDVDVADTLVDTVADEDTGIGAGTEAPYWNGGAYADDQRNLFTQTISGKVEMSNGDAYPEGTGIRADVVRLYEGDEEKTLERKAVVGNGYIDIRQGSNSEFSEHPSYDFEDKELDNSWITYALLNSGAVTGTDFDKYAKAVDDRDTKEEAYDSAKALNQDSKSIQKAEDAWTQAQYKLDTTWPDGRMAAYVEVTHGDGKTAPDGTSGANGGNTAQANGNASYGRTATLHKTIPNKKVNGTSYYPVYIDMEDGDITEPGDNNNVDDGHLDVVESILASSEEAKTHFQVLDTAYALVDENGNYRITVGVDEEALTSKSTGLTAETHDACVMISVKHGTRNKHAPYDLTSSCEPSFDSYIPFEADIEGDGTPTVHNFERNNMVRTALFDDGDWGLVPVYGTMARDNSKPLDIPGFFLSINAVTGAPMSLFSHDHGYSDAVFTMGLDPKKSNAMQLAFELGDSSDNVMVGTINPAPGAALGYKGDQMAAWYDATNQTDKDNLGEQVRGRMDGDDIREVAEEPEYPYGRLFVQVKADEEGTDLISGWHLVTMARGQSIADLVAEYDGVDAVILFEGADRYDDNFEDWEQGRDTEGDGIINGEVQTTVWFDGDTTTPDKEYGYAVGLFIHNGSDDPIEGYKTKF